MNIIFAVLIFSFLIFIHELGHFIAAKASGVQVNEFSIFMGPAIFKKQVGETLYSIRCIPFGGYCAMEGESEESDSPHSFQKAAWWKRLIILAAGAAMNFVTGVIIMMIVFAPAKQFVMPVIDHFEEGSALHYDGGLQPGDRFLKVDGERIYVQSDFSTMLSLNPGDVHDLVVERDGEKVYLDNFQMEKREFPNPDGTKSERFGFSFRVEEATLANKLSYAWNNVLNSARIVRLSLHMLFSGQVGVSDMTGPVGIVDQMNAMAQASPTWVDALLNMLAFGGFIAINLAIMNLLPIPALDGGHILTLLITTAYEKITGKTLNPKYEAYIHGFGMLLLLGLMAFIMFKDIFAIVRR